MMVASKTATRCSLEKTISGFGLIADTIQRLGYALPPFSDKLAPLVKAPS
jgi:hypothetical protein